MRCVFYASSSRALDSLRRSWLEDVDTADTTEAVGSVDTAEA
jgi:hypothetical protein